MSYDSITNGRVTWTNIVRPTAADMDHLHEVYPQFHPLALEDCLSHIERPKIDEHEDYMFVVMHFPLWDDIRRISVPGEVDFFLGSDLLVTAHSGELKPLNSLFSRLKEDQDERDKLLGPGASRLFHEVIDRLVDYIFPILQKVDGNVRAIEENLFSEDAREVIQDIAVARRDIIALRRILRPQLAIVANLEGVDRPYIREELDEYFGDILDHLSKARDIVEDNAEVIANLADTNDALVSYRINEVMRTLTVISIVILPLTLISGVLGMNVTLPFSTHHLNFWVIIGAMGILGAVLLIYFKYRRWL
mgnify:CR=1 FL=1